MSARRKIYTVAADLRCLQDEAYIGRGVGRHASALLRGAPDNVRLLGLYDPDMPPLGPQARALVAALRPNAYACLRGVDRLDAMVALSPMTHDPMFLARALAEPSVTRAAVVYDFIPQHEPERYLPRPADRLAYATQLAWLRQCDWFAPISQSSADELRHLLGVAEAAITVTGAPLDPAFERAPDEQPLRHIVVIGGGDARKNPDVVIRAHAGSPLLQAMGVKLVVAGNYEAWHAEAFRALAGAEGGKPDLVEVPGRTSDEALMQTCAASFALVAASRDEGFSLPVVEGMAAGTLCLASDIPAHRELVHESTLRFPPDDAAALTPLLERSVTDRSWRAAAIGRQAGIAQFYRASEVARRFWDGLLARIPARPAVLRGARPRVALASPLPPDRSGVADYTAASIPALGALVDLHLFTNTERPHAIPGAARIAPMSLMPFTAPHYDRLVSVIGNSEYHLPMFEALMRHGGACIAHDARMLGFYRIMLGQPRALEAASRELGRNVTEAELNAWLADEGRLEALFLGDVMQRAAPPIVHSPVTAELAAERYGVRPCHVPFSIYRPWPEEAFAPGRREQARARLGTAEDEVVIASFGFVHTSKAPVECIWALELLRSWRIPASLHFVGDLNSMPDKGAQLRSLTAMLGLENHVHLAAGFTSEQTYQDYLLAADAAVQLRTYALGGLSGGLLDCAAAGLPVVCNHSLAAAVEPPSEYTAVIPDALSPVLLAEALAGLLESDRGRQSFAAVRRDFNERRSMASYAAGLCAALGLDVAPPRRHAR